MLESFINIVNKKKFGLRSYNQRKYFKIFAKFYKIILNFIIKYKFMDNFKFENFT